MAEYIDREKLLDELGESASHHAESGREYQLLLRDRNIVREQPAADVIERAEYDKILEENKQLKRIISDKVNEDLKCAFEVKELRSKIDNALTDMQSMLDQEVLNDNVISDVGQGIEIAMGLLKRNIGE